MRRRPRIAGATCSTPDCPAQAVERGKCPSHDPGPWQGSTRRARLPADWPRRRRRVLSRDGHRCYLCGGRATQVDHIKSGDDHAEDNLAAICSQCHRTKSAAEGGNRTRKARR